MHGAQSHNRLSATFLDALKPFSYICSACAGVVLQVQPSFLSTRLGSLG